MAAIWKKANEYEIRTAADFAKVPAERIGQCLREFEGWLCLVRSDQTPGLLRTMLGANGKLATERFIWVDDGEPGLSVINLIDQATGETVVRVNMDHLK